MLNRASVSRRRGPTYIGFLLSASAAARRKASATSDAAPYRRSGACALKSGSAGTETGTATRDVQAIIAQTGWQRGLSRSAQDNVTIGTSVGAQLGGSVGIDESEAIGGRGQPAEKGKQAGQAQSPQKTTSTSGRVGASLGFESRDVGITNETAQSSIDIVNYDVRETIAAAERAAARASDPAATFSRELSDRILGPDGMRNRYLQDADSGRATFDITGPLTSVEQNSVLKSGRFSTDVDGSPGDGDSSFKKR